ncbi:MAG: glycosyltransferase [Parachlamydia sp.]|nr:glycosyltransferase [Parachlamydia sp.]
MLNCRAPILLQNNMLRQVWIIINYNLYESKRHFAHGLGEAFERKGIKTHYIDLQKAPIDQGMRELALAFPPDLCCSFNRVIPERSGQFFWDQRKIPYLSILVDPVFYDLNLLRSPYSYLSCVDQCDTELIASKGFERAFFWPHGVERELSAPQGYERPYDISFIGSCYDHEGLRKAWQAKYSPPIQALIEESVEIVFSEAETPFWLAVQRTLERMRFDPMEIDFHKICTFVDNYVRGRDRYELIRALSKIPDVKVHLFGGSCWREELPILGWSHYFNANSQVVVHPAIPYTEALDVMKRSKISLNSSPFFKKGSHERILTSLMCGSLPVSTMSLWTKQQFTDGQDLLLYRPLHWADINEKVHHFLTDEPARQAAVERGRAKVLQDHTWDSRVDQLLQFISTHLT